MKRDATPIEVASQALHAHSAGDWHRLATLADQDSVRAWRDGFVLAHAHVPTLAELAMEDPEVPTEALAQLQEERIARCQRFEANLPRVVAGVRTADELRALDPSELLVRYAEWMLRRQSGGQWRVLVTDDFLILPGEKSVMIDDPVVSKFLQG